MGFFKMMFKTSCIASHLHYNNIFMHYRCVLYLLQCCVLVGLDWAKPMMHLFLHVTCHMFMHSHAYVPSILYIFIYLLLGTFLIVSLSFSFSLLLTLVASWHLNVNPLCPRTLFVLGHLLLLLLLTPLPLMFGSMMRRPNRTSLRTFHNAAFIRNTKSFCQIFLTLTYPLSLTIGVRSQFVASWSCTLP